MNIMIQVKDFIDEIDEKNYLKYLLGIIGAITIVVVLLFYWHNNGISNLKKELRGINRQRKESRELLERHEVVKNQKKEVNEILEKDRAFKIKEYFSQVLETLNLQGKSGKEVEISRPEDLENGYSEISLDSAFSNMTMQDLCGLLYETEKNPRVYLKELSIVKAPKVDTLDVTLSIATLQKKAGTQ